MTAPPAASKPKRKPVFVPPEHRWRGGPVPLRATADQLATITRMRSQGSTERGIALAVGVTAPTFLKWKSNDQRVRDALDRGYEQLHDSLVGTLLAKAQKDTIALIYATKSLLGMRDNDAPTELRPQITINLPGAVALADLAKTGGTIIDATRQPEALPAPVTKEAERG